MSKARWTPVAVASCTIGLAVAPLAHATLRPRWIRTTQRITTLVTTAQGATNVGTSDGRIAGTTMHGALRAIAIFTSPSTFAAIGTLFYPAGALRYKLHGTETHNPDGSLTIKARGTFIGGTGRYGRAHGRFTASGTKPAQSFETWTLIGTVTYR
jgi:hypothetical protein